MTTDNTCITCGRTIPEGIKRIRSAPARKRQCRRCGTDFTVCYPHWHQMYCSAECRKASESDKFKSWYSKHRKCTKKEFERTCRKCGAKFVAQYTQQYCEDCINSGGWYMNKLMWNRKVDLHGESVHCLRQDHT